MELRWFRVANELKAVLAFMEWQGRHPTVTETPTVLGIVGYPAVVLFINGEQKAKGLFEIVKYFETAGLCYC